MAETISDKDVEAYLDADLPKERMRQIEDVARRDPELAAKITVIGYFSGVIAKEYDIDKTDRIDIHDQLTRVQREAPLSLPSVARHPRAIVFDRFGDPRHVLQMRMTPLVEPLAGEARVRMVASIVNPSDLLAVRGAFGHVPILPATPGYEGFGIIDKIGPRSLGFLSKLQPGRRVAVVSPRDGTWQDFVVVPTRQLLSVPDDIPDSQAAAYFVDPATALVMTQYVLSIPKGAWVLQTGANNSVGRMIIRLGLYYGFRTINVVTTRAEAEEFHQDVDAPVVCIEDENIQLRVNELTQGKGVRCALDVLGGEVASSVLSALSAGGRMLAYGQLTETTPLDYRLLILGQKRVEGFWLAKWICQQRMWTLFRLRRRILRLMRKGVFDFKVGGVFTIDEIHAAISQVSKSKATEKVLLRMSG